MPLFKNIHTLCFDTIDSTHTWCKKNRHTFDAQALTCVSAREQTAGHGRHGRVWLSTKDLHATLCFTLPPQCTYISNLGQVLSLSAASILSSYGYDAEIKWPNDVRIAGKKIAGVLCDVQTASDRVEITLSIGLNVNMPSELLERIDQPATSLYQISGHLWDVPKVLDHIVERFVADLALLFTEGFAPFYADYTRRLAFKGKEIRCNSLQGICQGILSDGRLVLQSPDGEKHLLSAGDIHLSM